MCAVMEEKTKIEKNTLQAFEPVEVRIVEIAPQRMLCQSPDEPEEAPLRTDALSSYSKIYF